MKKKSQIICFVLIVAMLVSTSKTIAEAYASGAVIVYAQKYAETPNSSFYEFSSDCTNFVSQCTRAGGISMNGSDNTVSAPAWISKIKLDSDANAWYMKKVSRSIGYDYWVYSKPWACVTDFRTYFAKTSVATVTKYSTSNSANIIKRLNAGDIVQYDEDGYAHSIVISSVTKVSSVSTNVKYCAHSSNRKNESIDTFFTYVSDKAIDYVYVIHFE